MKEVSLAEQNHGKLLEQADALLSSLSAVDSVLNGTYGSDIEVSNPKEAGITTPLEDALTTLSEQLDKAIERVQGQRDRLLQITKRL